MTSGRPSGNQLRVVIIGNGIAGITAARQIRKLSDHVITVISSESKYFFSRTALMYVYMGHMRQQDIEPYEPWFWDKNRIELIQDHVVQIRFEKKQLILASGQELGYDKLIIACGSDSNSLNIPGIDAIGVKGLYSLQDLQAIDAMSPDIKRAVVIGGGLIGIELAEMLSSRKIPVTFLIRETAFWNIVLPKEEAEMINQHIREHHIDLKLNSELLEIRKNNEGKIKSVITIDGEEIPCDFAGLTIGVHPNIDWLKDSSLEINDGILVDEYLRTNLDDVFAIGDCVELRQPPPGRKPIEAIWYTGRMMGETIGYTICGKLSTYQPGTFYNSAKFFDIEYQVYGDIQTQLPSNQKTIFWQSPDKKKSIRINYTIEGIVLGFNLMGVRFRQEVCEKWITQQYTIEEVLQSLELADFDTEFSEHYAPSIRNQYQLSTGRTVQSKKIRGFNHVHQFLNSPKILAS